jgi:DNA-binding beta-propeller fold protein YncE
VARARWLACALSIVAGLGLAWSASLPALAEPPPAGTYFDLIVDPGRARLYGSNYRAGTVDVLSTAGQVIASLPVGQRPAGVDLSPDGRELAVALSEAAQVAFVDVESLKVTRRVTPAGTLGPNRPWDVVYGRRGRLYSVGNSGSEGIDFVHTFDAATKAELGRSTTVVRAAPRLAITADGDTLFVAESDFWPNSLQSFDVRTSTPERVAGAPHGSAVARTLAIAPDGGRLFASSGQVWPADLTGPVGNAAAVVDEVRYGLDVEYAPSSGRLYISGGSTVYEVDAASYAILRQHAVAEVAGVARVSADGGTLYISTRQGVERWALHRTLLPISFDG